MAHVAEFDRHSRNHGNVAYPCGPEHSEVAFDFRRRAERLCVIVGELNRGLAFNSGHLADQADWVKVAAAGGIAAAEIVGQESSPTCAETNAAARGPLPGIVEIGGATEIVYRSAAA